MSFQLEETTIAAIHAAFRTGELTCTDLVRRYLARIEAYDKTGPTLNSIITVNPRALEEAKAQDEGYARTKSFKGALHGIPVVVKDQAETAGIMTTFGSIAADGYVPAKDATAVGRLRAAGAIILAKTTMPDWATSWFSFSSKSGLTKNPYDLARDPGGSSSGTGAAVAANFGAIGVGEDTGGSIRLPASFNSLVGIKVTPGLISRAGMSPLVVFQDSAGPMCRTVRDVATLLEVMVGFDPEDPYTAAAMIAGNVKYSEHLDADALKGVTLGVVRGAFGANDDPEAKAVNDVMAQALAALKTAGAKLVDVEIPNLMDQIIYTSLYINHSKHDIDGFLAKRPQLKFRTTQEIYNQKKYHPNLELFEMIVEGGPADPLADADYWPRYAAREKFQRNVVNIMGRAGASALVFPTVQLPPPTHADIKAKRWTTLTYPTNTLIAAQTWMPAVSLPAGYTKAGLPVGIEMMGLPYREADLLSLAYAFEQATKYRRPPASAPPLK
jgi:Asp-tRNA(Asn)/Glu-tRNA(Gln) amidotransferase A subunit family amidase